MDEVMLSGSLEHKPHFSALLKFLLTILLTISLNHSLILVNKWLLFRHFHTRSQVEVENPRMYLPTVSSYCLLMAYYTTGNLSIGGKRWGWGLW